MWLDKKYKLFIKILYKEKPKNYRYMLDGLSLVEMDLARWPICDIIDKKKSSEVLVVMEHGQYFIPLNHGTIDMVTDLCFLLETVARLYQKYVNCEQTPAAHENCSHAKVMLEWKH